MWPSTHRGALLLTPTVSWVKDKKRSDETDNTTHDRFLAPGKKKKTNAIYCISLSRLNPDLVRLCFLLDPHPGVMETKQEKHKRCDGLIVMWGTRENEGPPLKTN